MTRSAAPLSAALFAALTLLSGCESVSGPGDSEPISITDVDARVVKGYTDFGFDVFRHLSEEEPDENIFFSGTSLAFALAMTYHGADGETRREMGHALGVEDVPVEEFNASNAEWLGTLLDQPGDTELAIANSVWARLGFPFESNFLERNETFYRAAVEEVDFGDPATVELINAWVSEQTHGRIDGIVEEIDPLDIMFLINAVYFLGEWTHRFPEDGTSPEAFTFGDGTHGQVPMMTMRDTLEYHEAEGYQAVRLPYGEDGRFAMYVFLPAPGSSLGAFYQDLDGAEWERRIEGLEPSDLELRLPRFTLEYEQSLIPALAALGIEGAFDPSRSDFSLMTQARDDLYISDVLQKTFVQVNETGTEAAAVTSVTISVTSMPSHPMMVVNRPFFFGIRDDHTGTILFQGQITTPKDPEWEG